MARYVRKRITWKDGVKPVGVVAHRLPPVVPEVPYNGSKQQFQIGNLFVTRCHLEVVEFNKNFKPHEFRYVNETWTDPSMYVGIPTKIFKVGSVAIYAGPVRVEEMDGKGHTISCLRHSFIIEGGRYMTCNLNNFQLTS